MAKRNSQGQNNSQFSFHDKDFTYAKRVMADEATKGRLPRITYRHHLNNSVNLWEGEQGMMEHLVSPFPMPDPKADDIIGIYENSNPNEPSTSGCSASKKPRVEAEDEDQKSITESNPDSLPSQDTDNLEDPENQESEFVSASNGQPEGNDTHSDNPGKVKKPTKKQISSSWRTLISFYLELQEIQQIPFHNKAFKSEKQSQRKRVKAMGKMIDIAVREGNLSPEDTAPLNVKKQMNFSEDIKFPEVKDLWLSVKKLVQHCPQDNIKDEKNPYTEEKHWTKLISIYKDALELKKTFESPTFDSPRPSNQEFNTFTYTVKSLDTEFRKVSRKSKKGFSEQNSISSDEIPKEFINFSMKEVSSCLIYIRNLIRDKRRKSYPVPVTSQSEQAQGQNTSEESLNFHAVRQYLKNLNSIVRKYTVLDSNMKEDSFFKEDVKSQAEKLSEINKIKLELKQVDEELAHLTKDRPKNLAIASLWQKPLITGSFDKIETKKATTYKTFENVMQSIEVID